MQKVHRNKIVVTCGMKGIGKTTVLEQMTYGNVTLESKFPPTIEDIYLAQITPSLPVSTAVASTAATNETLMPRTIQYYDTAGLNDLLTFGSSGSNQVLPRHYLQIADAFLLFYSCDKLSSLEIAKSIKLDIDRNAKDKTAANVTVIVVGNVRNELLDQKSSVVSECVYWCEQNAIRHFLVTPFHDQYDGRDCEKTCWARLDHDLLSQKNFKFFKNFKLENFYSMFPKSIFFNLKKWVI